MEASTPSDTTKGKIWIVEYIHIKKAHVNRVTENIQIVRLLSYHFC